jgi:hypothetical protein
MKGYKNVLVKLERLIDYKPQAEKNILNRQVSNIMVMEKCVKELGLDLKKLPPIIHIAGLFLSFKIKRYKGKGIYLYLYY